jgi:hypothetical protein
MFHMQQLLAENSGKAYCIGAIAIERLCLVTLLQARPVIILFR